MLKPLTRPYVQVAQGIILFNKVDKNNNEFGFKNNFIAKIQVDTSIKAPTVVYAMAKGKSIPWYPDGFDYQITNSSGK